MDKTEIISRIVTVRGLGFPNSNPDPDPISESTKTVKIMLKLTDSEPHQKV
jgi:hypothetical protein